jgi:hypothetical protein
MVLIRWLPIHQHWWCSLFDYKLAKPIDRGMTTADDVLPNLDEKKCHFNSIFIYPVMLNQK